MLTEPRRAVIVTVDGQCWVEWKTLLEACGYSLISRSTDGVSALQLIEDDQPDLLLADVILPRLDGACLVEQIYALPLLVHPQIILMQLPGFGLPGAARLAQFGVAVLNKPLSAPSLESALTRLSAGNHILPPEKVRRLDALIRDLGIPDHVGRDYLICAVGMAWMDRRCIHSLKGGLYPAVAQKFGKTPDQIERALRHVIDVAWQTGEIEQQHRIFGDTIDARRGKPTCGETIAQLADILRWEGRQ